MESPNPSNTLPYQQNPCPSNTFIDSHLSITISESLPPNLQSKLGWEEICNIYLSLIERSLVMLQPPPNPKDVKINGTSVMKPRSKANNLS